MDEKVKALIESGDKYLTLLRDYDSTVYDFPGGTVEENDENILDAGLRELKEELGFFDEINDEGLQMTGLKKIRRFRSIGTDEILNIYPMYIEAESRFEPNLSKEHKDYRWLERKELHDSIKDERLTHYRLLFFKYVNRFKDEQPSKNPKFYLSRFTDDDQKNLESIERFLDYVS